jgi:hypothetical protein
MALFKDFDRDAFLGAFFQTAATGIQESREKAEAYKEKEEAAYERNIALIQQRDLRAKTAASIGKQALDLLPEGANSKAMVQTAMASGVQGVGELVEKLKQLHEREGLKAGERLSIFDVEAAISMPHISDIDPSMIQMSLEEFARRTYGAQATAAPVEDKTGVLGKLFGVGAKTRAKEELRKTPGFAGMSIADVNAAARQTEFNQLIPNAVMTITDTDIFGKKDAVKFANEVRTEYLEAYNSDAAERKAEEDHAILLQYAEDNNVNVSIEQQNEVKEKARKKYAEDVVDLIIRNEYAYNYPSERDGFFTNELAIKVMKDTMGEGWYNNLRDDYGLPAQNVASTLVTEEEGKKQVEAAEKGELPPVPTSSSTGTPTGTVTPKEETPPQEADKKYPVTKSRYLEVISQFTEQEWKALSRTKKSKYLGFRYVPLDVASWSIRASDYKGYVKPSKSRKK